MERPDMGEMLNRVLGDPKILSAAMSAAQELMGSGKLSPPVAASADADASAAPSDNIVPVSVGGVAHAASDNDRIRLLTALRPYLNEARCRRVDEAVRLLRLLELAHAGGLFDHLQTASDGRDTACTVDTEA